MSQAQVTLDRDHADQPQRARDAAHRQELWRGARSHGRVVHGATPARSTRICGENGAGKSTLMKILAGAITEFEGEIRLDGRPVRFSGPRQAEDVGIRIIYQELNLVPQLTVADNIFLGREKSWGGWLGWLDESRDGGPKPAGCSTAWARRSRLEPRSATCGSAISRWSRSPRRSPKTPRS